MSNKKTKETPPLIIKQNQKGVVHSPLPYDPGKNTYGLYANTQSPFQERTLKPSTPETDLSKETISALFRYIKQPDHYQVQPQVTQSPHRKRKVTQTGVISTANQGYAKSLKKHQDIEKLEMWIASFFKDILARLEKDPYDLPNIVNEIVYIFQEHEMKVRVYDAFKQFYDWYQFIDTLKLISEDPEIENFEFFCGALIGFYSQLQ